MRRRLESSGVGDQRSERWRIGAEHEQPLNRRHRGQRGSICGSRASLPGQDAVVPRHQRRSVGGIASSGSAPRDWLTGLDVDA